MAAEETLNAFFDELLTRCAPAARAPAPPPSTAAAAAAAAAVVAAHTCPRMRRAHTFPWCG
jgi:hypothetical protein